MINVSNRSVSCRKITEKGTKVFAEGLFLHVLRRTFLGQGSEEMSKEYACNKVWSLCHFCTWSFFFQKKSSQRWWTDILLPRSLSLAALLWITRCCYDVWLGHAIRWRFSCSQRKKLAICHFRLGVARARSRCWCPSRWEIRVSYVKSSCDVISRDLFLCDSSLFSVERIK